MYPLVLGPHAHGTLVETLYQLVDVSGTVLTVQTSIGLNETIGAILEAVPRLAEDHEVRANGLVVSKVGLFRVIWGVVRDRNGSLAVLVPTSLYETQDLSDWVSHYRREVLEPVQALAERGHRTGGGGNGQVTDERFAQAFQSAFI